MQDLTEDDRRRIYEEEKLKIQGSRAVTWKSWLKFLVLICLVPLVIYGVVTIYFLQSRVADQSGVKSSETLENLAKLPKAEQSFTLDLAGQLERIKSEGGNQPDLLIKNTHAADPKISYELLKKNADKYAGQPWAFTGKVLQIYEQDGQTQARLAMDTWENKPVWVAADFPTEFIENNRVYVVGYLSGNYSYDSIAGWKITLPAIAARAMLKPAEAAKLRGRK